METSDTCKLWALICGRQHEQSFLLLFMLQLRVKEERKRRRKKEENRY
jgi:hypothetical protein